MKTILKEANHDETLVVVERHLGGQRGGESIIGLQKFSQPRVKIGAWLLRLLSSISERFYRSQLM